MGTKLTSLAVSRHKRSQGAAPLVMLTAYDTPSATMADKAGADIILVGDSLAMVVLGHPDTLQVTTQEMAYHTAAVARSNPEALLVADMAWLSYHINTADTVTNAAQLIRAGAQAVKLEGGAERVPMVDALVSAQIPVMGHLGLTPQSLLAQGGYCIQGRSSETALALLADAKALCHAGCFAIVLEAMPAAVANMITETVDVPTIGIGAGPGCDGQVLVFHDVLGIETGLRPRFVRRYASLHDQGVEALAQFAADVRSGQFPNHTESYEMNPDEQMALEFYDTNHDAEAL
ncbi:MAG: 3-methyl-2-oxobutanoate hydroxymethyltransferase [Acidimicrobiia bacterium]|nr:3-methyl-2-oxobutanoate hydroxymethyltransferase [Acidimicrobiia bacterium]